MRRRRVPGRARQRQRLPPVRSRTRSSPAAPRPTPTASATAAPETGAYRDVGNKVRQATWQSPVTSRLLLEAGVGTYSSKWGGELMPGSPAGDLVRVTEQCAARLRGQRRHRRT